MPSPVEEVVRLFLHTAEDDDADEREGISAFSVRSPSSRLAYIDAMATVAGVSRNEMSNELLRVGISTVLASLPDDVRADIADGVLDRTDGRSAAI